MDGGARFRAVARAVVIALGAGCIVLSLVAVVGKFQRSKDYSAPSAPAASPAPSGIPLASQPQALWPEMTIPASEFSALIPAKRGMRVKWGAPTQAELDLLAECVKYEAESQPVCDNPAEWGKRRGQRIEGYLVKNRGPKKILAIWAYEPAPN